MLGGIGLLLMQRLPQDLVVQQFGDAELGLGQLQLGWLLLALAVIAALALAVRSDAWLRTYKYTWAAAGIALLAADLRVRQRRQRREAHAVDRAAAPASRRSC